MTVEVVRTPDERFAGLRDWPFEPRYVEVATGLMPQPLRVHYVDEGPAGANPVLLLHGEPTWSYLYRHMIPVLVDAGHRVVAIDFVGFGRSDKPVEREAYSYQAHIAWVAGVLEALDLRHVTLFGQDWGGLIGLRLVADQPERFARMVMSNTGLPTGERRMPDVWQEFRRVVVSAPELSVSRLVAAGCRQGLADEASAAYDAPFPDERAKAGPRTFPDLIPQAPDNPDAEANRRAWEALEGSAVPLLCAFSDDPITGWMEESLRLLPGAWGQPHTHVAGAGHFLQEDAGPGLARVISDFVE